MQELKVLVVEDQSEYAAIITKLLARIGIDDVVCAGSGGEAWEILEATSPTFDFILCDLNMPEVTGLDLLDKLRNSGRFYNMPFILMTSHANTKAVISAQEQKADGFIIEPFSENQLRACVKRLNL